MAYEALLDYQALYEACDGSPSADQMNYVFLEIQLVDNFEKRLTACISKRRSIYTGSNAYLLSGELATLLRDDMRSRCTAVVSRIHVRHA